MNTIKVYYRRNLKMPSEKLAAQVGHVTANLSCNKVPDRVIVLQASDSKFEEFKNVPRRFVQVDSGLTEVQKGTETCVGWWE